MSGTGGVPLFLIGEFLSNLDVGVFLFKVVAVGIGRCEWIVRGALMGRQWEVPYDLPTGGRCPP
jgi:hypothetical protein